MKSFLALLTLFLSLNSFGEVFQYRLYENSISQETPYILSITLNGPFHPNSQVTSVALDAESKAGKLLPLFFWNQAAVKQIFKFRWKSFNVLSMSAKSDQTFHSVTRNEIGNPWGDTSINPTDEYSFYTEGELLLNSTEGLNEVMFEIPNQTVEEMCLWGLVKKYKNKQKL